MTTPKSGNTEHNEQLVQEQAKSTKKSRQERMSLEDLGAAILARTQELDSRIEPHRFNPDG